MFLSTTGDAAGYLGQGQQSAQAPGTKMEEPAFCVSRQVQQMGQRVNVRFTVQHDQTLQAIPDLFQFQSGRLQRCLLQRLLMHYLSPVGRCP